MLSCVPTLEYAKGRDTPELIRLVQTYPILVSATIHFKQKVVLRENYVLVPASCQLEEHRLSTLFDARLEETRPRMLLLE